MFNSRLVLGQQPDHLIGVPGEPARMKVTDQQQVIFFDGKKLLQQLHHFRTGILAIGPYIRGDQGNDFIALVNGMLKAVQNRLQRN